MVDSGGQVQAREGVVGIVAQSVKVPQAVLLQGAEVLESLHCCFLPAPDAVDGADGCINLRSC
jgi:hypothetical protein